MKKTKPQDSQVEIDNLKKEIAELRGQSTAATLKAQAEDLKKQNVNSQVSDQQAMTNLSGYDDEFQRLKEDTVKQQRKDKKTKIGMAIGKIFSTPIGIGIVYVILKYTNIFSLLEFDANTMNIVYWVLLGILILAEINIIIELIKAILLNPEEIPDQTLSYLSLTAKEHVLDPKGSVIREKYGTSKWSAVTET